MNKDFQKSAIDIEIDIDRMHEGGSGKTGSVMSVGDASDGSAYRCWVKVRWDSGGANDYRRGSNGLLEVKCTTPANGEAFYATHLPKLGTPNRLATADWRAAVGFLFEICWLRRPVFEKTCAATLKT